MKRLRSRRGWPGAAVLSAVALLAALLGGCAALPGSPLSSVAMQRDSLDSFALEGRFSLHNDDKDYSGRLSWRHSGTNDELLLSSPFGQGLAQITASRGEARLTTSAGQVYAAADSEALTQQVLGYPLPLAQLTDWVRGRGGAVETDGQGRPLRLRHEDWRVDYEYDGQDAQALPRGLVAQRADGLQLRLRIDEWIGLPATAIEDPS